MNDSNVTGAYFSDCRTHRYILWRIWDKGLPAVMFIGLNPSKAGEVYNDNTITKVCKIARHNDFGGIYMANLYSYIATKPKDLKTYLNRDFRILDQHQLVNIQHLQTYGLRCSTIVFAWGALKGVNSMASTIKSMFTGAKCLEILTDGHSPKHPLYCLDKSILIPYISTLCVK